MDFFNDRDDEDEIEVPINNELERRIADAFDIFDHASNKTVDIREVGTIIRSLGCVPTEEEIQNIIAAIEEPDTPGSVSLIKFIPYVSQIIIEHRLQPATPEELLEAFRILDPENRGYLTREEISKIMLEEGEPFTQDELDEMLTVAVDPATQLVPYEYYINQLMHEPKEEDNVYRLADEIEAAKPKTQPKTFADVMKTMASNLD